MEEFEPSLLALLSMEIKNYRGDPTKNMLNPKVAHITFNYTSK